MAPATAETPSAALERGGVLRAGWEAYQRGDFPSAASAYRKALESDAGNPVLWYNLGCLEALGGNLDEAETALERALSADPRVAGAHDALGQIAELRGNRSAARTRYAEADRLKPGTPAFLSHLLRVDLTVSEPGALRDTASRLLAVAPDHADARLALGVAHLKLEAPDLAIHELRRALELNPEATTAWNALALAYAQTGEFDAAREAMAKARAGSPDDAGTLTNAGVVEAYQQRWDDARRAWEAALAARPGFAPARQNLEALDTLLSAESSGGEGNP
ncbi:MAG TPA: tetratricopeptide repeat protein [bacterium]